MDAAQVLRDARRAARLTQRALAARTSIPQPTIARIESGAQVPRVDTLDRLLTACGHDLRAMRVRDEDGNGVDRAQLRALLRRTPAERARAGATSGRMLLRAATARQVRGSKP